MKKILIVTGDYYKDISKGLLNSAIKKVPKRFKIKVIKVPGVFEIPVTISKNIKRFDEKRDGLYFYECYFYIYICCSIN